jgi:hypothetical protein
LRPSGIHRIFLYDQCVDMRKSFEGLSRLIEASFLKEDSSPYNLDFTPEKVALSPVDTYFGDI